jgi:hypothetical protein
MPIDFQRPIRSLRSLPETAFDQSAQGGMGGMQANDALLLRSLQGQRADELEPRLFNAIRTGDRNEAVALKGLIGSIEDRRESSPLGQDIARKELGDDFLAEQGFKAKAQGFDTPAAMAQYGRGQAEAKLRQPLDVARMESETLLEKQRLANQGAINLEQEQQKNPLLEYLQGGAQIPSGVKGMSVPGQGSVTFQSNPSDSVGKVPTSTYSAIQKARDARDRSSTGLFGIGGGRDRAQAALDQQIAAAFNQMNLPSKVRDVANAIAADPEDAQKPFDALAADVDGDPQMLQQLRQALSILRGRDF